MEKLKELIKSLERADVIKVRNYYKHLQDKKYTKRLELFNLIREQKVKTDADAAEILYLSTPNSAFSHLKKRLLNDILNVLLVNVSEQSYQSHAQARIVCRKKIVLSELLFDKSIYQEAIKALKVAAGIAGKNNLSTEKLLIKELITEYLNEGQSDELISQIEQGYPVEELTKLINAKIYYKSVVYNYNNFFGNIGMLKFQFEKLKEFENTLRWMYNYDSSEQYRFWYLNYAWACSWIEGNYQDACSYAISVKQILDEFPGEFSKQDSVIAETNLGIIHLWLRNFSEAETNFRKVLQHIENSSNIYFELLEIIFRISFYRENTLEADELIKQVLEKELRGGMAAKSHRWMFYRAVMTYQNGKPDVALRILEKCDKMLIDKAYACDLGYRLLELMILIDIKNWELAGIKLDAFKQLLKRRPDDAVERYKIIVRIISGMIKVNFNFNRIAQNYQLDLNRLASATDACRWDPLSFEIYRFDTWFEQKAKTKKRIAF